MNGPDGFTAGLSAYGAAPMTIDRYVTYHVEAVEGRFAGQAVETAVAVDELVRWPLVPPHWIYLHEGVTFPATNTQPCSMPGWVGHSRQIVGWGNDPDAIAGWIAHVRSVIGDAT
jgi:hypothetical protein